MEGTKPVSVFGSTCVRRIDFPEQSVFGSNLQTWSAGPKIENRSMGGDHTVNYPSLAACIHRGLQFSYRYMMILLPWIFVLLLESTSARVTLVETGLCGISILINAWASYLFLWTNYVQP